MATRSTFFDSVAGDRIYNADTFAGMFDSLVGDGYVDYVDNELLPTANTPAAMNVLVNTGTIWLRGRQFEVYTAAEVVGGFVAAGAGNQRWDRVVVKLDVTARTITLVRLPGVQAASNAQPPALTRTGTVWEASLAKIGPFTSSTTSITVGMVIDERNDPALCGVAYSNLRSRAEPSLTEMFDLSWGDSPNTQGTHDLAPKTVTLPTASTCFVKLDIQAEYEQSATVTDPVVYPVGSHIQIAAVINGVVGQLYRTTMGARGQLWHGVRAYHSAVLASVASFTVNPRIIIGITGQGYTRLNRGLLVVQYPNPVAPRITVT